MEKFSAFRVIKIIHYPACMLTFFTHRILARAFRCFYLQNSANKDSLPYLAFPSPSPTPRKWPLPHFSDARQSDCRCTKDCHHHRAYSSSYCLSSCDRLPLCEWLHPGVYIYTYSWNQRPVPPLQHLISWLGTALLARFALYVIGFWWVPTELVVRKKGLA